MADPKTVRINDAERPDRLETFEAALKRTGQEAAGVIRHLADAYIRYVAQHGHGPVFPVQITPFDPPKIVPLPAKKPRKGK